MRMQAIIRLACAISIGCAAAACSKHAKSDKEKPGEEAPPPPPPTTAGAGAGGKMLVVLSAPSVNNQYYAGKFQEIIDFDIEYAKVIQGGDDVVVLADGDTMPYLVDELPAEVLLESSVPDIWVRDFTTIKPSKMVQFTYKPAYLEPLNALFLQSGFNQATQALDLEFDRSELILDGGNVVDNNQEKAVVTERVLKDNPTWSREDVLGELEDRLGLTAVAIVPEEEGDTTGHSDGMVMWVSESTLLVNEFEEPYRGKVLEALRAGLPGVELIEVPNGYIEGEFEGFASACGININSLVTNDFIYLPVFGQATDDAVLAVVKAHTQKQVRTVPADKVCIMGGSVRCLSWQLTGDKAQRLRDAAAAD